MFEADMIGAIKIKDGLFIGDELASQVWCINNFAHIFFVKVSIIISNILTALTFIAFDISAYIQTCDMFAFLQLHATLFLRFVTAIIDFAI